MPLTPCRAGSKMVSPRMTSSAPTRPGQHDDPPVLGAFAGAPDQDQADDAAHDREQPTHQAGVNDLEEIEERQHNRRAPERAQHQDHDVDHDPLRESGDEEADHREHDRE